MQTVGAVMTGFDYLRITLAIGVLGWHSIAIATGSNDDTAIWTGPFRFLPAMVLPVFFALSGFLVAGSLQRTALHQFITLRVLRLMPALAVETALSALVLGLLFTQLSYFQYFTTRQFYTYFLNIVGFIHYFLPGVFENNPVKGYINAQLWTVPFELECYLALILLSVITLFRRRLLFTIVVVGLALALTLWAVVGRHVDPTNHLPGRALVLSFLAGVSVYLYRDVVRYSNVLGFMSMIVSAALLQAPDGCYLAALPVAYMTVWIGLFQLPKIPFGDLSYGVYLFHYPIEQTVVHLFPDVRSWWLLTLVSLPLTAIFAWLSWNLIEKPTLTRKKLILAAIDRAWAAMRKSGPLTLWLKGRAVRVDLRRPQSDVEP
jgi:peptidoglycan/LPS O-acetylase OafA/YrhL